MSNRRDKVTREIIENYKLIRAAHICYYTQLDHDIQHIAPEFFYLIGDILEGRPLDASRLRYVDLTRIHDYLKEDK